MPTIRRIYAHIRPHELPFLLCFGIVVMVEFLSRGGLGAAFAWSFTHLIRFAFNTFIIYSLLMLLTALIGRARVSFWILTPILFVLGLISGIKLKILGIPLLPWDFVLSSESKDMTPYIRNIMSWKIGFGLLLFFLISYAVMKKMPRVTMKLTWKERGITAVVAIIVLTVLYFDKPIPIKRAFAIEGILWNQSDNVKMNGFTLSTFMNMEQLFVSKLADYSSEMVAGIMKMNAPSTKNVGASTAKPNIIVVLSESLWDVTQIPGVTFNKDPLPNLHALQKQYSSGTMLSPQFGGGTANVEFEVLTGNTMRFLPQGSVPYNQYISKQVDSIASITARQGYTSTAVSPFHSWYYKSSDVYRNFGFHNYISLEYFAPNYEGPYIADNEVGKVIINATSRTSGPDFVFANTMENHFHYFPGKFTENSFQITSNVPAETKGLLETYARGANDADRMLQQLVEHYNSIDEPTIIVYFGDHLPSLGDEYKAFKESKYITGESDPDFLNKMYRVPLLIWNNYLPEQPRETLNMSPLFVSPYVLNMAKLPGSYYTDYLYSLFKKIPVIPPKNYYDKFAIKEADLKPYETLQYDILFGDQHAYKDRQLSIIDKDFYLGLGPIKIDTVTPQQPSSASNEWQAGISGQNMPAGSILFINGKKTSITWNNTSYISVKIPSELQKAAQLEFEIKVIDSQDKVIQQSNTMQVQPSAWNQAVSTKKDRQEDE